MLEKSAPSNTFPSDGLKAADSQRLPSRQASGQNENADGTDLVNSPSTGKGHDLSEQMHKTRKKRTLKDLVRACGKLGDMSDKSQLLAQWKLERKDIEWKAHPANVRLRKMIHELVLKLEQLDRDLQTQGGASGKVRDVARERYWEADAPLTSMGMSELLQLRNMLATLLMILLREPTPRRCTGDEMDLSSSRKLGSLPRVSNLIRQSRRKN
jgi:hypothetical protein